MTSARTLFVPVARPALAWGAAAVVLVADGLTASHDLSLYDSAELSLVCAQLGLGHPIGQPLHALLGFVFAHLPLVPPLAGLVALSVLAHALTLVPLTSIAESLAGPLPRRAAAVQALVLVGLALHWPVWESATRVEVYSLASFFVCWAAARVGADLGATPSPAPRSLFGSGVVLGLAGATNGYLAFLLAVALAPRVATAWRSGGVSARALSALGLGGLVGLAPYLYVPLVAGRTDAFVWGAPTTAAKLADYFRGADYARNRGTTAAEMAEHARAWLAWSVPSGVLSLAVAGAAGHLGLGRDAPLGRATAPLLFVLTVALLCSHAVFAVDIADYVDYLAPGLLLLACGTAALVARGVSRGGRAQALATVGGAALIAVALLAPPSLVARTRPRDHVARILAEGALREAPRGAVLLVREDHWVAPLLYVQEAEHVRPDVVIVPWGLSRSSWMWDQLFARHPELARVPLQGPGGVAGRVRRLLRANPGRAVHVSELAVAVELGATPCAVGFLQRVGECVTGTLDPRDATRRLDAAMRAVSEGSPAADGALAAVAMERGETLWRLGRARAALDAFRAGVPPARRPPAPRVTASTLAAAPPLRGAIPAWQRETALGDPARDLLMASFLLGAAGARDDATAHLRAAAALRLPEAERRLARPPE